ncbi:hypothetical protein DPMN_080916 [Dreissena polymorpha]|uniref:Uncharacterized protein n=1 Tax=Dreissena polymorpha TaxID=45954 RepID=A0A9D3Y404_DREPO|nr:hypothetical protein DPMN_080916 [Dreissena polymorpha]
MKSVQPVQESNPGHLNCMASALPTELTGPPHIFPPILLKFGTVTHDRSTCQTVLRLGLLTLFSSSTA